MFYFKSTPTKIATKTSVSSYENIWHTTSYMDTGITKFTLDGKDYHIVYLKADDVRGNLEVIRKERSDDQGNELWFPLMMRFFNECPFSKERGLSGEEDLINHFIHRQELELRICKEVFEGKYSVFSSKKYKDEDVLGVLWDRSPLI